MKIKTSLKKKQQMNDREYIVTYGFGDSINAGEYDYEVCDSLKEAMKSYNTHIKNGAITADVSKVIVSTES